MLKRLTSSRNAMRALGWIVANYLRLIYHSSLVSREPRETDDAFFACHPFIWTTWHGQILMGPLMKPRHRPMDLAIMVSRHRDAEIAAQVAQRFGLHPLRGAGAGERKRDRGGAAALRGLLKALKGGQSVIITADVPPGPARLASRGLIAIARLSGRPILPCAMATKRFLTLDSWSRFTINMPFSKLAMVVGEPIWVPREADEAAQELKRQEITAALNRITDRAFELAGGDPERVKPFQMAPLAEPGLGLRLYGTISRLAEHAAPNLLRWRQRHGKEDAERLSERFGAASAPRPPGPLVWFHAASIGETNVALPLIAALEAERPDLDFLLTTGTVTSAKLARARLPERAIHQYIPIDGPGLVARFLDHWRPILGVFAESEIWPNLVLAASAREIPLVLVNARLSRRSYRRWRRMKSIARPLFGRLDHVLTQNATLSRHFRRLGARDVITAGNLKIDTPPPPADPVALARLRAVVGTRPLLLAASTHIGEDEIIAEAHGQIAGAQPELLTIIVPRHPERASAIAELLAAQGLSTARRSEGAPPGPDCEVYIADTIGELGLFYALAPVAFIGGSLVPHGGQNPIEAIKHGAVVLTGPEHGNFDDAYKALIEAKGCLVVRDAAELAGAAGGLIGDSAARHEMDAQGRKVIESLGGAMPKTLEVLRAALPRREDIKRAS